MWFSTNRVARLSLASLGLIFAAYGCGDGPADDPQGSAPVPVGAQSPDVDSGAVPAMTPQAAMSDSASDSTSTRLPTDQATPPAVDMQAVEAVVLRAADLSLTYDEWDTIRSDTVKLAANYEKYHGKWIAIETKAVGFESHSVHVGRFILATDFKVHTNLQRPWLALPLWSKIRLIGQANFDLGDGQIIRHAELRNAVWEVLGAPEPPESFEVAAFLEQIRLDPAGFSGQEYPAIKAARILISGRLVEAYWFRRDYGQIVLSNEAGDQQLAIDVSGDRLAEAMRIRPGEMCQVLVNAHIMLPKEPGQIPAMSEHTFDGYLMSPVRPAPLADDDRLQAREVRDERDNEKTAGIDLSSDGDELLILRTKYDYSSRSVDVWNTRENRKIADLNFEGRKIIWGKFLPGDQEVLLEDYEAGEMLRVNIATREIVASWPGAAPEFGGISPDRTLFASYDENDILVKNLETQTEIRLPEHGLIDLRVIAFSFDNQLLAASSYENQLIRIWSLKDGSLIKELQLQLELGGNILLAFSPDGNWFATAVNDSLTVYDAKTFETKLQSTEEYGNAAEGLGFSQDSKRIVVGFDTDTIDCKNIESGDTDVVYYGSSMALDQHGTTIVIDDHDGVFRFSPITKWTEITY